MAIIPLSILVTFIPSLALASRRLHDIGKSGWWQILPLGGFILALFSISPSLFVGEVVLMGVLALVPAALVSRRLRDIGKSGWWQTLPLGVFILALLLLQSPLGSLLFLLLAPILFFGSFILFIVWVLRQGDEGPNKYGPDPRQTTS